MDKKRIVVIGAGLGGLAAAIRLAGHGHAVTLLERQAVPGGFVMQHRQDGFTIDMGATILVMRDVLDELWRDAGERLEDHLSLVKLNPNYQVHFADGDVLPFIPEAPGMAAELDRIEPGAGARYPRYLAQTRKTCDIGRAGVLEKNFRSPADYLPLFKHPVEMAALFARGSLNRYLGRFYKTQRVRDAFAFQTLYLGMTPFDSPAIYAQLAAVELMEGIWFPMGGMGALARALADLARRQGVDLRYGAEVARLEARGSQAKAAVLADGTRFEADLFVVNASLPEAYRSLLPGKAPARLESLRMGSSAAVLALGLRRPLPGLVHHNLFLPQDTRTSYTDACVHNRFPDEPFLYICASSQTDPSLTPPGGQSLLLLTMVPNLKSPVDWEAERPRLRQRLVALMEKKLGVRNVNDDIAVEKLLTPDGFSMTHRAAWGNPFGYTHHLTQLAWLRPHNRHATLGNVYFAGANTHPGGGVPIALLSGKLVAARIEGEWA